MNYKRQIGEIKLRGFLVAVTLCLIFAFVVYGRFKFVTGPSKEDTMATVAALGSRVQELDSEVKLLQSQVVHLQEQLRTDRTQRK